MIGWLDCQAGVSGDMLLGALVDAGVPLSVLSDGVAALGLGLSLVASPVTRAGLGACKVDVQLHGQSAGPEDGRGNGPGDGPGDGPGNGSAPAEEPLRTWAVVRDLLRDAPPAAHEAFRRLAEAEAAVHRVPVEDVHFHEVGALDALADIVGVCTGFAHLAAQAALTELHCSTVALGSGTTRGAHGPLPVPAPAVLALLAGRPVLAGPSPHESTTPTGAALLAALVTSWGPLPPMSVNAVGMGAGGREVEEVANVVRLVLGEALPGNGSAVVLEANVDDLDPRLWPHVLATLLQAGASDAWLTPILMKKGRPAYTLSVLCSTALEEGLRTVVFRETSTIGLRSARVDKHALARTDTQVVVGGQRIRVKAASLDGTVVNRNPEWEDVLAAATALGRPAKDVLAEAVAQVQRQP